MWRRHQRMLRNLERAKRGHKHAYADERRNVSPRGGYEDEGQYSGTNDEESLSPQPRGRRRGAPRRQRRRDGSNSPEVTSAPAPEGNANANSTRLSCLLPRRARGSPETSLAAEASGKGARSAKGTNASA